MLSATLATLKNNTIISVPTRLKESLEQNKKTLDIFRDLKENEKLGKQKDKDGDLQYYKVAIYTGMFISRWVYREGRFQTVEYLDKDFSKFMEYLDELLKHLEVDPFCAYIKLAKDTREFIDDITPGLYSLKKTYPECKEMVAKVDSIILTLIDFKDKADDLIKQKERSQAINLLVKPRCFEV